MDNGFEFTYSPKQQEEIKKIREKYENKPKPVNKLEELKRLDRSVEMTAEIVSLVMGVVGTLIMGVGMCCCLVWDLFILGVIIGIIGVIILSPAYYVYKKIIEKKRKKLAPRILQLTEELSNTIE